MNDKLLILKRIEAIYEKRENIIHYLKEQNNQNENTLEDIQISYDFQAGDYVKKYENDPSYYKAIAARLAEIIRNLQCRKKSIFECGVGEATILCPLLNDLNMKFVFSGGADISWSRIKSAQMFVDSHCKVAVPQLMVGDMFRLPLLDNSIDIVYTRQALEPNGGHEEALLKELYRVTNEYLVLIEPAYEMATDEGKKYMDFHGYIKGLYNAAKKLGYNIQMYEPYDVIVQPLMPMYIMVIKKGAGNEIMRNPLGCPVTRTPIRKIDEAYFSGDSLLGYPVMNGVPCLVESSAIVATKLELYEGM